MINFWRSNYQFSTIIYFLFNIFKIPIFNKTDYLPVYNTIYHTLIIDWHTAFILIQIALSIYKLIKNALRRSLHYGFY